MAGFSIKQAMLAVLAASSIALAQDAAPADAPADDDDEIVVTAQRREQSLLDVPVAVTALSGDDLANQGITNSAQLGDAVFPVAAPVRAAPNICRAIARISFP